ncbi:hypothetical protein Taro_005709, partial [Colocasia esculenta]|nr:hypothetical protein [Colocasia esculenta]
THYLLRRTGVVGDDTLAEEAVETDSEPMASRGRRGGAPAREDEPRCDERVKQQAPAPQGPVLPPPPPVDYGVFMQGLVQAMQTQAHTQAALQAQLEAQAGGRDRVIPGRKESFAEEASSDIPTARQEESGVPDAAAIRGSRQFSGTFCTFPWCEERVSPLWEDTWWYRMLDDYGKVLEVRKQRPQDQGLFETSAGSPARSASPSSGSGSSASYRKTRRASSPSSSTHYLLRRTGVVGDDTLAEEAVETDSERGD